MNWNRKFAILAVPAILAVGGGALAVHAASTPTPAPTSSQPKTGAEPAEAADPAEAKEAPEAADPAEAAGGADKGHADPAGATVDHQFEGNE